jgi:hypothetical protein
MRITQRVRLPILAALALFTAAAAQASYTYVWQTTDSGGINDTTGTIVLNLPSSPVGGGTIANIVSITLSDTAGTYTPVLATDLELPIGANFTWNPAGIANMSIDLHNAAGSFYSQLYANPNPSVGNDVEVFVGAAGQGTDFDGKWVAVPEPTTILSGVLMLLPFGATLLRKPRVA